MEAIPDTISHEALLAALELNPRDVEPQMTIYHNQLKHRLLTLARKARLEVAVHELTGIPADELCKKSAMELMVMLDSEKAKLHPSDADRFRHW